MKVKSETNKITHEELKVMQARTPERKVNVTFTKLIELCNRVNYKVAVSFSGGKDSTVLLDIVSRFWASDIATHGGAPLVVVFANTGNEFGCMQPFVEAYCKRCEETYGIKIDLRIVRPKEWFGDVVKNRGVPVASKKTAKAVRQIRAWLDENGLSYERDVAPILDKGLGTAEQLRTLSKNGSQHMNTAVLSLTGYNSSNNSSPDWKLAKKWRPLIVAPFKVSEECCGILKKAPIHEIQNELGLSPIIGEMASDSQSRKGAYIQTGCNAFDGEKAVSKPMGFWLESDVLWYIDRFNLPFSPAYGTLEKLEDGTMHFTGAQRTGCKLCLFGIQFRDAKERLVDLEKVEPATVRYAMKPVKDGGLGYKEVVEYVNRYCKCDISLPICGKEER